MNPTLRSRFAILSVCAGLAGACSWSVPADPGENARLRADRVAEEPVSAAAAPYAGTEGPAAPGTSTTDADPGARDVYLRRCGQCHAPFPPSHASAARWPSLVRHYGPRAGLFGAERERVIRWLEANASR